jgi:hypothetical protein
MPGCPAEDTDQAATPRAEPATKDDDPAKESARAGIAKALASRDLKDMRTAVLEGVAAGLDRSEIDHIGNAIAEEEAKEAANERKEAARVCITEAMTGRNLEAMRTALAGGATAGLEAGELGRIRAVIAEEEAKILARASIAQAVAGTDLVAMRKSIDDGVAAGLSASELIDIRGAVAEEEAIEEAHKKTCSGPI